MSHERRRSRTPSLSLLVQTDGEKTFQSRENTRDRTSSGCEGSYIPDETYGEKKKKNLEPAQEQRTRETSMCTVL